MRFSSIVILQNLVPFQTATATCDHMAEEYREVRFCSLYLYSTLVSVN